MKRRCVLFFFLIITTNRRHTALCKLFPLRVKECLVSLCSDQWVCTCRCVKKEFKASHHARINSSVWAAERQRLSLFGKVTESNSPPALELFFCWCCRCFKIISSTFHLSNTAACILSPNPDTSRLRHYQSSNWQRVFLSFLLKWCLKGLKIGQTCPVVSLRVLSWARCDFLHICSSLGFLSRTFKDVSSHYYSDNKNNNNNNRR